MTTENVLLTIEARGVARLTLNRPEKHNAFDDQIIASINTALEDVAARDDVRVLVVAAEGRSFSAGADLGWMRRMAELDYDGNLADARRLAAMLARLNSMPMPVVARVNGPAFGGAVGLVACCDMAVATERATFALSEVKLGLIPATIGPYVVRAMGERAARRYFLTGEPLSAHRAQALGLVSEVVAEAELDPTVTGLVETLLANGPEAVAAAKRLVAEVAGRPIDSALIEHTSELIAERRVSAEGQEGLGAFFEKRKPHWQLPQG
jgi:methylglutaconyl-CoA hydratase